MVSFEPIPGNVEEIASIVVDMAYAVHKEIGPGLLESAYETCLVDLLREINLDVKTQISMPVNFRGKELKDAYRIDILVNDCLIVEIKSIQRILPVHRMQLLTYLKFSGCRLGLLINFNEALIKDGISRVIH
jgi:GxxExxY protein